MTTLISDIWHHGDFPGGSDSKEATCNAEDRGLIPGSGRSLGEGNGYPLQSSYLENSMDRGNWWATVHRVTVLDMTEQLTLSLTCLPAIEIFCPSGVCSNPLHNLKTEMLRFLLSWKASSSIFWIQAFYQIYMLCAVNGISLPITFFFFNF